MYQEFSGGEKTLEGLKKLDILSGFFFFTIISTGNVLAFPSTQPDCRCINLFYH